MIENDQQLEMAQEAVRKLQGFLRAARKTHDASEYRLVSEPVLLEIQQREQEILEYLSQAESPAPTHSGAV